MRKVFAILLTIVMVMSISLAAFAEEAKEVKLDYTGEDSTTASITFHTDTQKVNVEMLVASMYEAKYETTYTVKDGVLTVADVENVTATDTTGMAALLGLPATMQINMTHVVKDGKLSVSRSAGGEAPVLTCEFPIDEATMSKLNPATEDPAKPSTEPSTEPSAEPTTGNTGNEAPKTGDGSIVAVCAALMLISAMGVAVLTKHKA